MPNFSPDGISTAKALANSIQEWILSTDPYLSPDRAQYQSIVSSNSIIINSTIGVNNGDVCPLASEADVPGNSGLYNLGRQISTDLDRAVLILKTEMTHSEISTVNSIFSSFTAWANNVSNYFSKPIPNVNVETRQPLFNSSANIPILNIPNPFYFSCATVVPSELSTTGRNLAQQAQYVLDASTNNITVTLPNEPPPDTTMQPLPEPVDTVMAPITVPENGAGRLFELMERLYKKINNEHYIIITRSNQINVNVLELSEYIGQILAGLKGIQTNVYENRTELKEARQGIKDLLGLGDKFYEGSVSTIELLERMNEIHQLENDVLYEIRVRVTENNSYLETIRNDTIDIDDKITELNTKLDTLNTSLTEVSNKITENFTQTNEYIFSALTTMEDNITARIEQMRQEQYQYTVDIIERINVIDTSVG